MSLLALGKLAREVCRDPERARRLVECPAELLAAHDLTASEREAVLALDAQRLVDLGLNPIVMRNLLITAGIGPDEIYTHDRPLTAAGPDPA